MYGLLPVLWGFKFDAVDFSFYAYKALAVGIDGAGPVEFLADGRSAGVDIPAIGVIIAGVTEAVAVLKGANVLVFFLDREVDGPPPRGRRPVRPSRSRKAKTMGPS